MLLKIHLYLLLLITSISLSDAVAKHLRFNNFAAQNQVNLDRIKAFAQDKRGYMYIASNDQLWRYDGYTIKSINAEIKALTGTEPGQITDLAADSANNIWIGTNEQGLIKLNAENSAIIKPSFLTSDVNDDYISSLLVEEQQQWLGLKTGLAHLDSNFNLTFHSIKRHQFSKNDRITSIQRLDANKLLVSTLHQLYIYNQTDSEFTAINHVINENFYFYQLYVDREANIWVGSNLGLFKLLGNQLIQMHPDFINSAVSSIIEDDEAIWFGSLFDGLWRVDKQLNELTQYTANASDDRAIIDNSITTLFQSSEGITWVGGFNGGISNFDAQTLNFGLYTKEAFGVNCVNSESIYKIITHDEATLLIWTTDEVVQFNLNSGVCKKVMFDNLSQTLNSRVLPLNITQGSNQTWVATNQGIFTINPDLSLGSFMPITLSTVYIFKEINQNQLLIGTNAGLMTFDLQTKEVLAVAAIDEKISQATFYSMIETTGGMKLFATKIGLVYINDAGLLDYFGVFSTTLSGVETIALNQDKSGRIWVGIYTGGLLELNKVGQLVQNIKQINGQKNISIYSIAEDDKGNLWLGSNIGLINYSPPSNNFVTFTKEDGLQGNFFNINSVAQLAGGKLVFGGRNGLNVFNPNNIVTHGYNHLPALVSIKRFNKEVNYTQPDNLFNLTSPIDSVDQLTLDHKDYVISIEFSSLNYNDNTSDLYAYKLQGFDPDWNYVSASNRIATYTNLPSGNYSFKLKAALKDKIWGTKIKSLDIKVLPPPWLTWWALTSYIFFVVYTIYWYVQRKIKTNQKIAAMLRIEVTEKTKELNIQKQTVESLLAKKNELFSNVSHEFRTPLTLILGPIKELLNKQVDIQDINSLKMVNRNANRLLSLVEQLLQIARVSDFKQVKTTPQNAQTQVQSLVDSFQHMAQRKKIHLQLMQNEPATIKVTDQFIDATMGNLLSNAIKYTQSGGSVTISSKVTEGSLLLSVKDTGTGLTQEQQRDIFKRFKRLESHQGIEGIGIGLSVVEEVVKINDGVIKVDSEIGVGSEFTVCIPLSDVTVVDETKSISTLVNQLQAESLATVLIPTAEQIHSEDSSLNTVLVIEDNHDMREHIISIVGSQYNCIAAENGVKGVAAAIEHIPDIIISDVMMPEMDGFKVARIIRSDQRTSHIPLMLLTALHDKTNRIKGWRENVDAYMTKPFDRDELLVHLENMLTIRDILKTKAGQLVKHGQSITAALPKKDKEFIDKLVETIQLNFQDPMLNRAKIASEMAVSDRQLQRKVKALIDQNPMDMLREFRLNKAKELLKDGYQVSQIADDCGFNSLSYFSQCFKAQNGISPKKYQQTE